MADGTSIGASYGKYESLDSLKKAFGESNIKDHEKTVDSGSYYSIRIFGDDALTGEISHDSYTQKMSDLGIGEDLSEAYWELFNTNAEGDSADMLDADEYNSLIKTYGNTNKDFVSVGSLYLHTTDAKTSAASAETETTTENDVADTVLNQTVDGIINNESAVAGASSEFAEISSDLEEAEALLNQELANQNTTSGATETKSIDSIEAQFKNPDKIQKEVNETTGETNYYVTADAWDANAKDNIDCVSRLIYNTYGVGMSSAEYPQILALLKEANADTPLAQEQIHPGQKINLVDASEILGLTVAEETSSEEVSEGDKKVVNTTQMGNQTVYTYEDGSTKTETYDTASGQLTNEKTSSSSIDKDGNTVISETSISYNADGSSTATIAEHVKDPSGKLISTTQVNPDSTITYYDYTNGTEGHPNAVYQYDSEANLISKEVREYAEDGTVTSRYFNAENVETDKNGNVLAANGDDQPALAGNETGATETKHNFTREEITALGKDAGLGDTFNNYLKFNNINAYTASIEELQTAANDYQAKIAQKDEFNAMYELCQSNPLLSKALEDVQVKQDLIDYGAEGVMITQEGTPIKLEKLYIGTTETFGAFKFEGNQKTVNESYTRSIQDAITQMKSIIASSGLDQSVINEFNAIAEKYENLTPITIAENQRSNEYNQAMQTARATSNVASGLNAALSSVNLSAQEKADLITDVLGGSDNTIGESVKKELRTNINDVISNLSDAELLEFAQSFEAAQGETLYKFMDGKDNSDANKNFVNRIASLYTNATAENYETIKNAFPLKNSLQDLLKDDTETTAIKGLMVNIAGNNPVEAEQYGISGNRAADLQKEYIKGSGERGIKTSFTRILDSSLSTDEKMYLLSQLYEVPAKEKSKKYNESSIENMVEVFRDISSANEEKYLEKWVDLCIEYKNKA